MSAAVFQGFELVLFFGAFIAFGVWQLIDLDREKKKRDRTSSGDASDTPDPPGSP